MFTDNWGFTDVEAAVASIPAWIKHVEWKGPRVDVNQWIMTGHSNGGMWCLPSYVAAYLLITGQGTWYGITHRPDKVLAAAPISGYASIQSMLSSYSSASMSS
jgi:hypothetical protein